MESGAAQLVERIEDALKATGYFSDSACEVNIQILPDGRIRLSGIVCSYYLKQQAQVAVLSVARDRTLNNELVVMKSDRTSHS